MLTCKFLHFYLFSVSKKKGNLLVSYYSMLGYILESEASFVLKFSVVNYTLLWSDLL